MASRVIFLQGHATVIFFLFLSISSGLCAAKRSPPEPKQQTKIITHQKQQMMESSFTMQRDTIPIINPTTPGTETPIINPVSPPYPVSSTPILPYPVTPILPYPVTPTPTTPTPTISTPTISTPTIPTPTISTPTTPTPTISTPTTPTPTPTPTTTSGGGSWCIANPGASETALQVAIDYACGYGGADCSGIQPGASCYNPNTLRDHASYAFNDYYQKNPVPTSCVFGGTAQVTYTDPSQGSCHFSSSRSSTTVTPPAPVTATPVTPITDTPPTSIPSPFYATPMTPYGVAEPTGSPSSAISTRCSLLLLITSGLLASVTADYLL